MGAALAALTGLMASLTVVVAVWPGLPISPKLIALSNPGRPWMWASLAWSVAVTVKVSVPPVSASRGGHGVGEGAVGGDDHGAAVGGGGGGVGQGGAVGVGGGEFAGDGVVDLGGLGGVVGQGGGLVEEGAPHPGQHAEQHRGLGGLGGRGGGRGGERGQHGADDAADDGKRAWGRLTGSAGCGRWWRRWWGGRAGGWLVVVVWGSWRADSQGGVGDLAARRWAAAVVVAGGGGCRRRVRGCAATPGPDGETGLGRWPARGGGRRGRGGFGALL